MSPTITIARRELASLFYSPIAYVVLGLFALGSTLIFFLSYGPGQAADMRNTLNGVLILMIFLVPAISMRLISEEARSGTIESLMTSPIKDSHVILGKWTGAMGFLLILFIPLLVLAVLLEATSSPDWGPILSGLLGLLLVGGLYLAIGTFASTMTQNQIIAFIVTVSIICLLTFVTMFLPRTEIIRSLPEGVTKAMYIININNQFIDFPKGLIDTGNFVYFITSIAFFLFLAVLSLQSKRWR